jgi:hypothetical protein
MNATQIKHMVDRFLSWKLPATFNPDGGIAFEPIGSKGTQHEFKREPVGTNLLDATQAAEMVRHMVDGLPAMPPHQERVLQERAELAERRDKLAAFLSGPIFPTLPDEDAVLLQEQFYVMGQYVATLDKRIARF